MDTRRPAGAFAPRTSSRVARVAMWVGVAALTACGSSDQAPGDGGAAGSGAATDVDACSLLTSSQIGSATGLTWGGGTLNAQLSLAGRSVCDWHTDGGAYAAVQVMVVPDASDFDANRASASEVFGLALGDVSIDGADDTYATEEGSLIAMRLGGRFVQVSYVPPGPGNVLSVTQQLAQAVAAGL